MAPIDVTTKPRSVTYCNVIYNYKCGKCNRLVKNGVLCDGCDVWYHFKKCSNILETTSLEDEWFCQSCTEARENGEVNSQDINSQDTNEGKQSCPCIHDNKCNVSKFEEEIKSLHKIISLLQKDLRELMNNTSSVSENDEIDNHRPTWAKIVSGKKSLNQKAIFNTHNRFEVLSDVGEETTENSNLEKISVQNKKAVIRRKSKLPEANFKRINILSDSHGKDLSVKLSSIVPSEVKCLGLVKPNARINECIEDVDELKNEMNKKDIAVIFSGANDVYRNESINVSQTLKILLPKLKNTSVVVCGIPTRYDLMSESIVNKEIKKTNAIIVKLCKIFNCLYLDTAGLPRECFTTHGLHLNNAGKLRLAQEVYKCFLSINESKTNQLPTIALDYNDMHSKN